MSIFRDQVASVSVTSDVPTLNLSSTFRVSFDSLAQPTGTVDNIQTMGREDEQSEFFPLTRNRRVK